jgi:hypothetical protein
LGDIVFGRVEHDAADVASSGILYHVIDGVLEMAHHERRASPTSTTENSSLARIVEKLERCAGDRMTREQAVAIVEKYVTDHPEEWHLPMAGLVLIALGEGCPS